MRVRARSLGVAGLLLCGPLACVGEVEGVEGLPDEPYSELSSDEPARATIEAGQGSLVDLTRPVAYSIDNERGDVDLQSIAVRAPDGELTTMSDWLGESLSFESLVVDEKGVSVGTPVDRLLGAVSFNLPKNSQLCFDVGWMPGGQPIEVTLKAQPYKARILLRRRLALSSPWDNVVFKSGAHSEHITPVVPKGYYQACAVASSKTAATGVVFTFNAPAACGSI